MAYSTGRVVHDADAHLMETPTGLRDYADPRGRAEVHAARPEEAVEPLTIQSGPWS